MPKLHQLEMLSANLQNGIWLLDRDAFNDSEFICVSNMFVL